MVKDPAVVVQITDTHLFSDRRGQQRGVVTYETFEQVLSLSRQRHPQADAYVFTGDLSQDGSPESYQDFKSLIGGLEAPSFVIPGNHDDVANMNEYLVTDSIRFEAYTDLGSWRIIFINSQTVNEEYGSIDDEDLASFKANVGSGSKHHLVCLHHPPILLGTEWLDRSRLQDSEAFFEVVDSIEGRRALIWGHAHQQYLEQTDDLVLMGTPSTCVQFKPGSREVEIDDIPPGYRVLKLFESGQVETEVVRVS